MEGKTYQSVGQPVRKKDAMALLLGKPAYVDDVTPRDCLVVKVLRSPHAHALIEEIDTSAAMKVPGIAAIFTYRDVPQKRFTMAGQTYPEPSPYDRLILDQRVRFVGDAAAIVAGETEQAVDRAMKLIPMRPWTAPSSSTPRTAGAPCVRWGRTTGATCAPARPAPTATWIRSWQTAPVWWTGCTTPRPATRP